MVKPIKIKHMLQTGELDVADAKTSRDVCNAAAGVLDRCGAAEISGIILFQGVDKKFYTGTVEFCIEAANPMFIMNTLTSEFARCPSCGHLQNLDAAADIGPGDATGDCLCDKCTHICFKLTADEADALIKGKTPKRRKWVN